jgi:hypothetical protein
VEEWVSEDEYDVPAGFEEEGGLADEFAAEPLYTYHTAMDERVCPQCAPLEGVMFTLDEINEQFPSNDNYEDIIFVNAHDKCRCQLTREVQSEEVTGEKGESENMPEGRGTPLRTGFFLGRATSTPSLYRMMLNPSPGRLSRFMMRWGMEALGLSALIFPILAVALPMLQAIIQEQVKLQVQAELRRRYLEEEKKRADKFRLVYSQGVPE